MNVKGQMTNDRATFSLITSRNIDSNIGIRYITITYNILLKKNKQNKTTTCVELQI